jgi:hypothetical protein
MFSPATKTKLAAFFAAVNRRQIDALATQHDLPMVTMA